MAKLFDIKSKINEKKNLKQNKGKQENIDGQAGAKYVQEQMFVKN